MSAIWSVALVALGLSTAVFCGLFVSYRRRLYRATARDMGFKIPTVRLADFDARFRPGELGVSLDAEAVLLPAVGKVIGGTSEREAWVLAVMAKGARRLFEFGTATGRTTYLWARNSPPGATIGTLTLHPDETDRYTTGAGDSRRSTSDATAESRFDRFIYSGTRVEEKVEQYFGDSKEFDEREWLADCDVVFVDGSHAYSYVRSDSQKALRMVKPGGVVLWHDYRADRAGKDVRRYLDRLFEKLPLVRLKGTRLVAYRAPAGQV